MDTLRPDKSRGPGSVSVRTFVENACLFEGVIDGVYEDATLLSVNRDIQPIAGCLTPMRVVSVENSLADDPFYLHFVHIDLFSLLI
jgi:hypothetical protein